jgi:hypothetical protein
MVDVRVKPLKVIKDKRQLRVSFASLEEASDYYSEHALSEKALSQLEDAPELDDLLPKQKQPITK